MRVKLKLAVEYPNKECADVLQEIEYTDDENWNNRECNVIRGFLNTVHRDSPVKRVIIELHSGTILESEVSNYDRN